MRRQGKAPRQKEKMLVYDGSDENDNACVESDKLNAMRTTRWLPLNQNQVVLLWKWKHQDAMQRRCAPNVMQLATLPRSRQDPRLCPLSDVRTTQNDDEHHSSMIGRGRACIACDQAHLRATHIPQCVFPLKFSPTAPTLESTSWLAKS